MINRLADSVDNATGGRLVADDAPEPRSIRNIVFYSRYFRLRARDLFDDDRIRMK